MSIYVDGVELTPPIPFEFVQGEDVNIELEFQELLTETNPNLTGATIESSYTKEYGQDALGSLTVLSSDPANATWTLRLPAADSINNITPRRNSRVTSLVFDIKITYSGGTIHYPVYGYLKMQRRVTS